MHVELQRAPQAGVHWNHVKIGYTYQSVRHPEMVVVVFSYQPDDSVKHVKMALPVCGNGTGNFVAFHPADSTRWLELDVSLKVHGKV